MMSRLPLCAHAWAAAWLVVMLGCSAAEDQATPGAGTEGAAEKPFKLGDMLEPFVPPPLEELNRTAEWFDQPVLGAMEIVRRNQRAEGPPPLTVEEVLALQNNSAEDNANIMATLGQLAPEDGSVVDYDATWVRHVGGDLRSTNPLLRSSTTEFEYLNMTGMFPLAFDAELKFFAPKALIVSWQTSNDRLMDKLVLRDDLTWSDGKRITAHDIEFTFKVIMSDAVIIPAVRQGTDQIKWVQAYDDQTVVYFHKQPLATNALNIHFPIIPKHVYERSLAEDPLMTRSEYHSYLEDHPVVAGPYELVKRVRNQEYVLRRREGYYMHNGRQVRDKPYFAEVRVKVIEDYNTALLALKAGQIEEMMLRPEQWIDKTNGPDFYRLNTKVTALEWSSFHFGWNLKSPFFSDRRVREAMSWAFDYDEFLNVISHGMYQPNRGTFHPTSWMFPKDAPEPFHQDLDKTEDLLDEAGWIDSDGDGVRDKMIGDRLVPFEFTMLTYQSETGIQAATLMKECLDQIGVVCHVKPTEFAVLQQLQQDHKFEASMGGWGTGEDPDTAANLWVTGEARNYVGYSNPRVDELFELGRREFGPEKRAAIYGEIHNLLWKDQPNTWLFYRNSFFAFNKKLRGYTFSPRGPYDFDPGINSIYQADAGPP